MSSINLDNPWLLFVALPLIVLFTVPFALAIRKDNLNGHNLASGIIHVVMAIIIAFAAAGTSIITTVTQTDVYVLADVSYSSSLNLDKVDKYINELELPPNSRKGVVCFANGQRIVTRLGERFNTVKNSGVDPSSTNIVDALKYTGSLFRDDVIKRIVLITDGKSTDGSDNEALRRQINSLAERKIHVDAIFIDNNMASDVTEVQMSNADFTPSVSLNREEKASLTVQANCPDGETVDAIITLYKDGEVYVDKTAYTLDKGNNTISFGLDTSTAGAHDYTVKIECEGDANPYNNEISFTQSVSGKTNILLIAGSYDDYYKINEIYADKFADDSAELTPYINRVDVPITIEELCRFDEIIISDFDVSTVDNCSLFLENLDTVVSKYGKSLITFGNTYIQGRSDAMLSQLNDMLPVTYGNSAEAPKLYTILIDTSRSMGSLQKLENAKTASKQIVNMLTSKDKLNIIEFNANATPLLTAYSMSNGTAEPLEKIDNLKIVQGTVIGAGIERAYSVMKEGNYSEKRLILITDGMDLGNSDIISQITQMRKDKINTLVLDAGRGNNNDANATAAAQLLKEIAQRGNNGVPYDISSADNIKEVIEGEIATSINDYMGTDGSYITVNRQRDEALEGIASETVKTSYVDCFIKSQAKANAKTVLNVSYYYELPGVDDDSIDMNVDVPLYAYWQYGNGRTASFTSSLSGSWISNMSFAETLFANVLDTCVPEEKANYPFKLEIENGTGSATISLEPANLRNDGWAKYKITAPDGTVSEGDMSFGSKTYAHSFITPSEGKYTVSVTYGYSNLYEIETINYFNVDYSAEYDSFAIYDASSLIEAIGSNGSVSKDGKLKLENDEKEVGTYNMSLTMPLLVACVALYAVDIAVRKLKWEDIKSLFGRGKK